MKITNKTPLPEAQRLFPRTLEFVNSLTTFESIGRICIFGVDPSQHVTCHRDLAELKRTSFKKLTIEGHTDSMGRVEYNNDLSLRRSNAIRDYLTKSENVATAKIETSGFGPSRPIASNGNYQGRQVNRRVEFIIER